MQGFAFLCMASPKFPRKPTQDIHPPRNVHTPNSPSKSVFEKEKPTALSQWGDTKVAEWEASKQEREARLNKLVEDNQMITKERNKKMEDQMQIFRDEFDQTVSESKKQPFTTENNKQQHPHK